MKYAIRIIYIFLGLALFSVVGWSGFRAVSALPSYEECEKDYKDYNAEQSSGQHDATGGFISDNHIHLNCVGRFIDRHNAIVAAVSTVVIAVFTFFLVVIGRSQGIQLKRSVDLADASFKELERAFVYLSDIVAVPVHASHTNKTIRAWQLVPKWKNSGTTATRKAVTCISFQAFDEEMDDNFVFRHFWEDGYSETVPIFLGPKAVVPIYTPEIQIAVFDYANRKLRYYLWGWIDYDDGFQNTDPHRTEFCVEILVTGDTRYCWPDDFRFRYHGIYNGADKECLHKPTRYRSFGKMERRWCETEEGVFAT